MGKIVKIVIHYTDGKIASKEFDTKDTVEIIAKETHTSTTQWFDTPDQ